MRGQETLAGSNVQTPADEHDRGVISVEVEFSPDESARLRAYCALAGLPFAFAVVQLVSAALDGTLGPLAG